MITIRNLLAVILISFAFPSLAQNKEKFIARPIDSAITELAGTITSLNMKGYTEKIVNLYTSKLQYSDLQENNNNEEARADLRKQFEYSQECLSQINMFNTDLARLGDRLKLINNHINSQQIISPTSNFLGYSFTRAVFENAEKILTPALKSKQRSTFSRIAELVVNNPLVTSLAGANPLTSLARDMISQVINVSNGNVNPETLNNFKASLEPYLLFYGSIDTSIGNLKVQLTNVRSSVGKLQARSGRIESEVLKNLELTSLQTAAYERKLEEIYKIPQIATLDADEINSILLSTKVRTLNQLTDRLLFILDQYQDEPQTLQIAYNNHIAQMIELLRKAKNNPALKFDATEIEKAVNSYEFLE